MNKYEEEKSIFGEQLLQNKKLRFFSEYINALKETAQIEDLISDYMKK